MERTELTRRGFVAASFGVLAVAALGMGGCNAGSSGTSEQEGGASDAVTETPKPAVLSAALRAEEQEIAASEAFFAITPAMTMLKHHVFEGLFDLDPHTGSVRNGLATGSPKRVNATTYEVTLRDGATFSDGSPVQASHVAAAYQELLAHSAAYTALLVPIATVSATNARTVRITLTADEPAFLQERLSLIKVCAPVKDANATNATDRIGTGPWMYAATNPLYDSASPENALASGERAAEGASDSAIASMSTAPADAVVIPPSVVFAPNPQYAGDATTNAESMAWYCTADDAFRVEFFKNEGALAAADVPPADAGEVDGKGTEVEYVPGALSPYIMFNCAFPPFNDPNVRQAVLYAIDYDRLISDVFDGHASRATCALPATHANYHRAKTVYSHDVTRAQHALERAGITPSAPADFSLVVCEEWLKPVADRIVEDLKQVGVNVTVQLMDAANFMAQSSVFNMVLAADDPTLVGTDADLYLTWRYGGGVAPESACGWQTSEAYATVMENLRLARTFADDKQQQQKLWNECFDIIAESAPLYPLCFCDIGTAWNNDALSNFSPLGTGCIDFVGVDLR